MNHSLDLLILYCLVKSHSVISLCLHSYWRSFVAFTDCRLVLSSRSYELLVRFIYIYSFMNLLMVGQGRCARKSSSTAGHRAFKCLFACVEFYMVLQVISSLELLPTKLTSKKSRSMMKLLL